MTKSVITQSIIRCPLLMVLHLRCIFPFFLIGIIYLGIVKPYIEENHIRSTVLFFVIRTLISLSSNTDYSTLSDILIVTICKVRRIC